jgi:hypothetical protein
MGKGRCSCLKKKMEWDAADDGVGRWKRIQGRWLGRFCKVKKK